MLKIVSIAGLALAVTLGCDYASAGVQLQGRRLQGVRLQGVRLQGVRLQGVRLQGTSMQGRNLSGMEMHGTPYQGDGTGDDRGLHVVDGMRVISISFPDGATHAVR